MSDSNYSEQDTKNDTVETNPTKVFFKTLFQQVIWLIIYIFVGGYMLYCSKISQSGLMPTDIKLMPYRSESALPDKPIEPIININYIKEKDITLTNKIYFPYIYNKELIDNSFITGISSSRNWIESLTSNVYTYYFGSIWQNMTSLYIQLLFGFYGFLNANFIETLIVFGGPYIILFVLFFINIIVGIYGVVLYFAYIPKLFSQKKCVVIDVANEPMNSSLSEGLTNHNDEPIVEWNDNPKIKGFGYSWFMTALVIFIALVACLFGSLLTITYFLVRSNFTALFLPLFMKAQEINGDSYDKLYDGMTLEEIENVPHIYDDDEEYTYYTVIEHILKFKKRIIMLIVSYYVLIDSYLSMGTYGAILAIVGCILLYIFFPDIYKNYKKNSQDTLNDKDSQIFNNDNLTPVIGTIINKMVKNNNNKESIKRDPCDDINNPPKKIGFFGTLFNFLKDKKDEADNLELSPLTPIIYGPDGNPINPNSKSKDLDKLITEDNLLNKPDNIPEETHVIPTMIDAIGESLNTPSVPTIVKSIETPLNKTIPGVGEVIIGGSNKTIKTIKTIKTKKHQ